MSTAVLVRRICVCLTVVLSTNARLDGQTSPILAKNIEQVRYADQFLQGGSDIGAAINAAFTDCEYQCVVKIPAKTSAYTMTTPVTLNQGETLCGDGSANTTLQYSGSGYAITITPTAYPSFTQNQVKVCGLTLLGTSSASGGINMHDVIGTILDDLAISGFTGSNAAGIWMNNQTAWTERTSMLHVALGKDNGGNSIGIRMSLNPVAQGACPGGSPNSSNTCPSFGYSRFLDLRFNVGSGQTGMQIENGALFYDSTVVATFNIDGPENATAINVQSGGLAPCNDISLFGVAPAGAIGIAVANNAVFTGQGVESLGSASNTVVGNGVFGIGNVAGCQPFTQYQNGLPTMSTYSAPSHSVSGYSLSSGTDSVTLGGAATFSAAGNYFCTFSYNGAGVNTNTSISYQQLSGSQFVITSEPYIGVNYVCSGH
jgi:hypothetical protein